MPAYTFDVKLFATVYVTAPDEMQARLAAAATGDVIEGAQLRDGPTNMVINSAAVDGEFDLMQVDGEDV